MEVMRSIISWLGWDLKIKGIRLQPHGELENIEIFTYSVTIKVTNLQKARY